MIMKRLTDATAGDGPQRLLDQMTAYPLRHAVAFWHIGDRLGRQREIKAREDEVAKIREGLAAIRGLDDEDSHLTIANVDGELPLFARAPSGLDMVGIQPRLWSTAQDFLESYDYLNQRRLLTVRSNLGVPVLGLDSGIDSARGDAEHLGRRPASVLGNAAGPARATAAHDLPRACGRISRPRLHGRRRLDSPRRRRPRPLDRDELAQSRDRPL